MNPLLKLIEYGQSYWLDNLTRGMIKSGDLKKRVTEQGLRGVTSNPAIFNKAISKSGDYDDQIRELVQQKKSVPEIYEALVVKDVQDACDILRPVYDESDSQDGFVSLEVSPHLAHDTHGTMGEARRLFGAVNRPNVFIKIPGTPAGVPAIEEMLYEGININITLLFSIEAYAEVARAYIRALERRAEERKSVNDVASVASFFLSRIDVLGDQLLGQQIRPRVEKGQTALPERLIGKVAIANAKVAYQRFKEIFSGDRWQALAEKGASVQRVLWASSSTKDPLYSRVRYVEPLIGPRTVNTMPEETIEAFATSGVIRENSVEAEVAEAENILRSLPEAGVDLDKMTWELINEGIQKFVDPYDSLMKTLFSKRKLFQSDKLGRQTMEFSDYHAKLSEAYTSLDTRQFSRRIYEKDPFLWQDEPQQRNTILNRLGWLSSIDEFLKEVENIKQVAREVKEAGFTKVVLLGMGGSSLCPEVCRQTFGSKPGWPELLVLDNTAPQAVQDVDSQIKLDKTLFVVSSKSGTTTETMSFYQYFYDQVLKKKGESAGKQFIAITDPETPLANEGYEKGFRCVFENPADIGGRYSALSFFGLVPMALLGMDIELVLMRAKEMQIDSGPLLPTEINSGISLGAFLGLNHRHGHDKVTFILSPGLQAFAYWVEQLLAESTGKSGLALLPVQDEPLSTPNVYGKDRVFVYIHTSDENDDRIDNQLSDLEEHDYSVASIDMGEAINLGAEFYRWEVATATVGAIMGINPFDEPNVAESKENTRNLLKQWQQSGFIDEGEPVLRHNDLAVFGNSKQLWFELLNQDSIKEFLTSFFALAKSRDYVALLPYLMQTESVQRRLQNIRQKLRDRRRVATTLSYGPRYLHSTGQLHKGGSNQGVFLIITSDATEDVPIPGHDYGFEVLQRAQALGDFRALDSRNRRVVRLHLGKDIDSELAKVEKWLS